VERDLFAAIFSLGPMKVALLPLTVPADRDAFDRLTQKLPEDLLGKGRVRPSAMTFARTMV
jgi:hypothetical protein